MSDTRDGPADKLRAPHEAQEAHALHDAAIAAGYRAASLEMPGAAADAAILAQARAAARLMAEATGESTAHAAGGAANDASWSRRLRAPLALAACAVLAVGIVTRISVEAPEAMRGEAPAAASAERRAAGAPVTASAPDASAPDASAPAVALATPPASADTAIPSAARAAAESRPVTEPPPESVRPRAQRAGAAVPTVPTVSTVPAEMPVAPAAPAQDVPPLQERKLRESAVADATSPGPRELPALAKGTEPAAPAAADSLRASAASGSGGSAESSAVARADKRTIARTDHSAAAGAGPPASGGVMRKSEAVQIFSAEQETALAPERWLAYLIDLRRSGQHAAADASLARFRARYPDHAVPPGARGPQPFPAEVK